MKTGRAARRQKPRIVELVQRRLVILVGRFAKAKLNNILTGKPISWAGQYLEDEVPDEISRPRGRVRGASGARDQAATEASEHRDESRLCNLSFATSRARQVRPRDRTAHPGATDRGRLRKLRELLGGKALNATSIAAKKAGD